MSLREKGKVPFEFWQALPTYCSYSNAWHPREAIAEIITLGPGSIITFPNHFLPLSTEQEKYRQHEDNTKGFDAGTLFMVVETKFEKSETSNSFMFHLKLMAPEFVGWFSLAVPKGSTSQDFEEHLNKLMKIRVLRQTGLFVDPNVLDWSGIEYSGYRFI